MSNCVGMNKDDLFSSLGRLVEDWTPHEDIRKSERYLATEIGRRLYKLGGEGLMRDAYYHARDINRCASILNLYWDGIGDWMS